MRTSCRIGGTAKASGRRRLAVAVLMIVGFGVTAHAQHLRFRAYSEEQGIGDLAETTVLQDRTGAVLLGTESGLYRTDGASFVPFDVTHGLPPYGDVLALGLDADGRVWTGLTDAIFVEQGDRFHKLDPGSIKLEIGAAHRMALLGNAIVVSNGGTISEARFDSRSTGRLAPLFGAARIAVTPALAKAGFVVPDGGTGFLMGCGQALCRVVGESVETLGTGAGLPADAWQVALRGRDGTLWARSLGRLAFRVPGARRFTVVPIPGTPVHYVSHPDTLELVEDPTGRIVTQGPSGLLIWDRRRWRQFGPGQDGLPDDGLRGMTFDREGSLWVASRGEGLFRSIGYGRWEHWSVADGLPNGLVWAMGRAPGGPLWVATDLGSVPIGIGQAGAPVVPGANYIVTPTRKGRIWLAPIGAALARVAPDGRSIERARSVGTVETALVDRDDRLWLGTNDGVFSITDADGPIDGAPPARALDGERVHALRLDGAGRLLVLGDDGLFRRERPGTWTRLASRADMPPHPRTLAFGPRSEIWIGGASTGVSRFRPAAGGTLVPLSPITTPTIGSNSTLFLCRDRRGWMWLGTYHGIDLLDGQGWRHFDIRNGPMDSDMSEDAVFEDPDGSMWFGTSRGLSHLIDPIRLGTPAALHPVIRSVRVGDRTLDPGRIIHLGWDREPFEVAFGALDFAEEQHVSFRYRLRGVDTGWSDTAERVVHYAGLPPGKLRFEVMAIDPGARESSAPVGFTIDVRAPPWRRGWFIALSSVLFLASLASAWRLRVALLIRQRRLLETLVQERTAEIEEARRHLFRQANTDALTGLSNRRAVMARLDAVIKDARLFGTPLAIVLVDVDHFKTINDRFGHLAGDAVLQSLGGRLRLCLTPPETAGRYGGEEFLVILPGRTAATSDRIEALRRHVTGASYALGDGRAHEVTISGGVAWLRPGDNAFSLLARADTSLYMAKAAGRDRLVAEAPAILPAAV